MGPQQSSLSNKKSILHISRRMVFRDIQRFEIVIIVLDIRTTGNLKSHSPKNIDNLIDDNCKRMDVARFPAISRQRHINRFFPQRFFFLPRLDNLKRILKSGFEELSQCVELLAGPRPFIRRKIFEPAQEKGESSLAP